VEASAFHAQVWRRGLSPASEVKDIWTPPARGDAAADHYVLESPRLHSILWIRHAALARSGTVGHFDVEERTPADHASGRLRSHELRRTDPPGTW